MPLLKGKAHTYGSNVNTDEIIPARYLNMSEIDQLASHCLEDLDQDFMKKVQPGDVLVAGDNFGCGSSREHAPLAIRGAGISCVIARSFARIFYRNAINIGLPILESREAVDSIQTGDELAIDLASGEIKNLTQGKTFHAKPYPQFMLEIMQAGGLLNKIKKQK